MTRADRYQHIGSKGNLWNDLHMTPTERRHLVVTPTVLRGYQQQERTLEKRVAEEQDQEALRMERTQLLRQQRRFHLQDTQRRTAALQLASSQIPSCPAHARPHSPDEPPPSLLHEALTR